MRACVRVLCTTIPPVICFVLKFVASLVWSERIPFSEIPYFNNDFNLYLTHHNPYRPMCNQSKHFIHTNKTRVFVRSVRSIDPPPSVFSQQMSRSTAANRRGSGTGSLTSTIGVTGSALSIGGSAIVRAPNANVAATSTTIGPVAVKPVVKVNCSTD